MGSFEGKDVGLNVGTDGSEVGLFEGFWTGDIVGHVGFEVGALVALDNEIKRKNCTINRMLFIIGGN